MKKHYKTPLSFSNFYRILVESARSSAAVGLVIGGALILNYIVASENIPDIISDDNIYYNRSGEKSVTQPLRNFHNLYIKHNYFINKFCFF